MFNPKTPVGCPFGLDTDPEVLRQCVRETGHGGDHRWYGVDGFYITWTEKVVRPAPTKAETPS